MSPVARGALVEYYYPGGGQIATLGNTVLFQFNPEKLSRTIQIPTRPTPQSTDNKEASQAGDAPFEKISFTAQVSAMDDLGNSDPLALQYGIAHRLAAIELMMLVRPEGASSQSGGGAQGLSLQSQNLLDGLNTLSAPSLSNNPKTAANGGPASGSDSAVLSSAANSGNSSSNNAAPSATNAQQSNNGTGNTPRLHYPKVLFVWGSARILPVYIESMSISETMYDLNLNPIEAEVQLSLTVTAAANDSLGVGAMLSSTLTKMNMADAYYSQTADVASEIVPF